MPSQHLANHMQRIVDRRGPFWNWILLAVTITSTSLDPLFFYIFVVNDQKKCVDLDTKLAITAISLRTIFDFFSVMYSSDLNARNDFTIKSFLKNHLSCLPIPQVVTLIIIVTSKGSAFFPAMVLLKVTVIVQYVPRFYRIYWLYALAENTSGILDHVKWIKAGCCVLIYLLAAHVFGSLWYLMAIEIETECWKKACKDYTECHHTSFYCYETFGNYTFLTGFCPTTIQDTKMFNFGIFIDALQSGMVEERDFSKKFIYCFRWGLQTVSCAGQNLQTSTHMGENLLAIFIIISSLLLLLLVLGNITIYLQFETIKSEKIRFEQRSIEQWNTFAMLSQNLQRMVKNHQQFLWQDTRGIDVENLLNRLPENLIWEMKSDLFLKVLEKVPIFDTMGTPVLSVICKRLKPVLYAQESYIVKGGDQIDQMLFFTQGTLTMTPNDGRNTSVVNKYLTLGDFWGEELVTSALDPDLPLLSNLLLPQSKCTVSSATNVEAFALQADDLRAAVYEFWQRQNRNMQPLDIFRLYSPEWRTSHACVIQAFWRFYKKRQLKRSLLASENLLPDRRAAEAGGEASGSGTVTYASGFSVSALNAVRRSGSLQGESVNVTLVAS